MKARFSENASAVKALTDPKNSISKTTFFPYVLVSLSQIEWKTILLGRSDILELLVRMLTADDKNYRHGREKLREPIEM